MKLIFARQVLTCNTCQKELAFGQPSDPYHSLPVPPPDATQKFMEHQSNTGHLRARMVPELIFMEVDDPR